MRFSALLREAWRDTATGASRALWWGLAMLALMLGAAVADLGVVRGLDQDAAAYRAAGASVITVVAPGRVDGSACEALSKVPGIRASGAMRDSAQPLTAAALPSSTVPSKEVTAGLPAVLNAASPAAGAVVSDQLAEALALAPGDTLATTTGSTPVAAVYAYPDDGRRAGHGYAAWLPIPAAGQRFDECWADAWPTSARTTALLRSTLTGQDGQDAVAPVVSALNASLGTTFNGAERFEQRPTALLWAGVLIVATLLTFLSWRARRLALASALHAGVRRRDLWSLAGLETAACLLPAALTALGMIGVLAAAWGPGDSAPWLILGARPVLAAVLGSAAGAAVATLMTREKDLFRYFKQR